MRVTEFYSPLSFLRILLKVNRNRPYRVIQMKVNTSRIFKILLRCYNSPMYHTLKHFSRSFVWMIFTLSNANFHQVCIEKKARQSRHNSNNIHSVQVIESMPRTDVKIVISRKQKCNKKLCQAKINYLKPMLHLIPLIDRQYYDSVDITEQWSSFYLMRNTDW